MAASFCRGGPLWGYGGGAAEQREEGLWAKRYGGFGAPAGATSAIFRQGEKLTGRPDPVRISSSTATRTEKKIAKLYVKKLQTVPLPAFSDASGNPRHLSVFLREPEGRQCMLNTKSLRKLEHVDNGVFRCYLPTMDFLSFQVGPVLDLLVEADEESCQVDMLSCKFEGSALVRSQNERFSASLRNHLSWSSQGEEQHLHVRLELNVALEVYTLPFTLLPIAAVESPGTLILQALVDRLVPLFLDQLFTEFQAWAEARGSAPHGGHTGRLKLLGR